MKVIKREHKDTKITVKSKFPIYSKSETKEYVFYYKLEKDRLKEILIYKNNNEFTIEISKNKILLKDYRLYNPENMISPKEFAEAKEYCLNKLKTYEI